MKRERVFPQGKVGSLGDGTNSFYEGELRKNGNNTKSIKL